MALTRYSKFQLENHPVVKTFIDQEMIDETYSLRVRVMCVAEQTVNILVRDNPGLLDDINLVTSDMCQAVKPQLYDFMGFMERGIARIKGPLAVELVVKDQASHTP